MKYCIESKKVIIFSLLIVFLLISCDKDKRAVQEHKTHQNSSFPKIKGHKQLFSEKQAIMDLDVDLLFESWESKNIQEIQKNIQIVAKAIDKANRVLQKIYDPENKLDDIIEFYNKAIVYLYRDETIRNSSQYNKHLLDYKKSIYEKRNLYFYKKDADSTSVIKLIAKHHKKDIFDYYRLLKIASEIYSDDKELETMISEHSLELFQSYLDLKHKSEQENNGVSFSGKKLREFKMTVSWALVFIKKSAKNNTVSNHMVSELFNWIENGKLKMVLGAQKAEFLASLIIKKLNNEKIWIKYLKSVRRDEEQVKQKKINFKMLEMPLNINQAIFEIKQLSPNVLNMYKTSLINPLSKKDKDDIIYYNIIGKLGRGEKLNNVPLLWNFTKKNNVKMLEMLENQIKIFLLNGQAKTNKSMLRFYKKFEKEESEKDILLNKAIEHANIRLTPMWNGFFRKIGRYKLFVDNYISGSITEHSTEEEKEMYKKVIGLFDHLNKNVQYLATYPNILMLTYYAKKYGFDQVLIKTAGASLSLNSTFILEGFFQGKIPAFLNFREGETTSSDVSLDSVEIMYGVYYAIYADLFNMYEIDPKEWFKQLKESYLKDEMVKLRTWKKTLDNLLFKGAGLDAKNLCNKINNKSDKNSYENHFSLSDIFERTYFGTFNDTAMHQPLEETLSYLGGNRPVDYSLSEALEIIRSDLNPKLHILNLVIDIYKKSVSARDNTITEIEQKNIDEMHNLLAPSNKLRKSVVKMSKSIIDLAIDCHLPIALKEKVRRSEIFDMELEYLRHTWIAIDALNLMKNNSDLCGFQLEEIYGDHSIWHEPFFSTLNKEEKLYSAIDSHFKKNLNLEFQFKTIKGYRDSFNMNGRIIRKKDGDYTYNYRIIDFAIRVGNYLSDGYNNKTRSEKQDQIVINWPTTIEQLYYEIYGWKIDWAQSARNRIFLEVKSSNVETEENLIIRFQQKAWELFGSIDWFSAYGPVRTSRNLLRVVTSYHKLKYEMDVFSEDEEVVKQNNINMRNDFRKIMKVNLSLFELFKMQKTDKKMLSFFPDKTSFYKHIRGPRYLYTRSNESRDYYIGIADELFSYVVSFHLGYNAGFRKYRPNAMAEVRYPVVTSSDNEEGPRNERKIRNNLFIKAYYKDSLDDGLGYFNSFKKKRQEQLIFPINDLIQKSIKETYSFKIIQEMRLIKAFEDVVDEYEKNYTIKPYQFSYLYDTQENPYFLTNMLLQNFRHDIQRFNKDTGNVFVPNELCDDSNWAYLVK